MNISIEEIMASRSEPLGALDGNEAVASVREYCLSNIFSTSFHCAKRGYCLIQMEASTTLADK